MKRALLVLLILAVALPAIADTETQLPSGAVTFTSVTGGLTDVDEDIDSPDGNWAVATSNTADPVVSVSFDTPTGDPSGTNTFRIWVREFDSGQTGTATLTICLDEGGVEVSCSSSQNVTSGTGEEFTYDWSASSLGTADGSAVEARVNVTHAGGGPGVRQSADVGAINWEVNYSSGWLHRNRGKGPGFGGVCCEGRKDR